MSKLKLVKKDDAKPEVKAILSDVEKKYGFIPNLMSAFADSPPTLQGYLQLSEFTGMTLFSPEEQQAIFLATSYENGCEYCMAAHSMMALKVAGMPKVRLDAIRSGKKFEDKKFGALVDFTKDVVRLRGNLSQETVNNFLSLGYTNQHVLEVILGVTMKTLSNYVNHLAETPLDKAFQEFKWMRNS